MSTPTPREADTPDLDRTNVTREAAARRSALITVENYTVHADLRDAVDPEVTGYPVETTIRFRCTQPGASVNLDFIAESVQSVQLNGEDLDVTRVVGAAQILLPELAEENTVTVHGTAAYSRSGEGMHRFVDPTDGATYLYTQYEPADARRVFPNFEQPDLKARFTFSLTGPASWVLASNRPEAQRLDVGEGLVRVDFEPTLPQSTYITTLLAGPYTVWEDAWDGHDATGASPVPLRLFTRASLAEHFDPETVFAQTKSGLTLFHELFGVPYEWGKYDQAFVPEYNLGAMENPGLVTFTEAFVFTSPATQAQYEGRANVIMHEMAHMWFGDLVTMTWWDDLWLKESFADYMGSLGVDEATDYTGAWVTFAARRKAWAYVQDQLPTTHPIVADIVDLEAARQNFDGITYAKGASVLKQLAAYVGRDAFLEAARTYFRRHAWGNARLADFMAVLEEASGRDITAWAQAWLHTSGVPRLHVETEGAEAVLIQSGTDPVSGEPMRRPQVVKVGLYEPTTSGALLRTASVQVDVADGDAGLRTSIPGLQVPTDGVRLVLPNDEDLTYAAIALDEASLDAVLTHPVS
ncbi:MAG: aminopeptidase N, partial [Brachybacterium sp.]|nr:aminopeptidase N [Brachybacterium sp.]